MLHQGTASLRSNDQLRELIRKVLAELAVRLDIPIESNRIQQSLTDSMVDIDVESLESITLLMMRAAQGIGIRLAPVELRAQEAWELTLEGFAVVDMQLRLDGNSAWVYSNVSLGKVDATRITLKESETVSMTRSALLRHMLPSDSSLNFVAEPSLVCDSASSNHAPDQHSVPRVTNGKEGHHHDHDHHDHNHLSPQRRIFRFLRVESRDIWSLAIFGIVVGVLDLATPLAVEQMVTTIGFASLTQPLIWLAVLLFSILFLSAVIKALQFFIVEILQRRMFVRIVGDLSERLPRLERSSMDGIHGPEMANRFFDVMTMQKSTASLLVEGLSLVIQTVTGLLLLALYSPFLLAFDIVLIICMTVFLLLLGRNAVRTAIEESLVKYRVAHWLQDVIGNPTAFQVHGAGELVSERANRLTVEYLAARRKHFVVLMRQTFFSLILYAISITSIMSLGVWLVLTDALSMGQLVASVSVVALVVGAFAKVGKSLESYYDLMSATDKVGHLIDLPTLPPSRSLDAGCGPVEVRIQNVTVSGSGHHGYHVGDLKVASGERFAVHGEGECGKSLLIQTMCGLRPPASGLIEIGGIDSREVNRFAEGSMVSIASAIEVFHGTLAENVSLNRLSVSSADVREALMIAGLWDEALGLSQGLDTLLQSGGYPLSTTQAARLMIARAVASKPRLLLIDTLMDLLPDHMRQEVWSRISDRKQPWTLIVATHCKDVIEQCDGHKDLRECQTAH